jgi:hypothetical protein
MWGHEAFSNSTFSLQGTFTKHRESEALEDIPTNHFLWQMKLKLLREAGVGECTNFIRRRVIMGGHEAFSNSNIFFSGYVHEAS